MIQFDITKFKIKNVYVKYITKSRGGNMSILDTSNKGKNEKFKTVPLPAHVAAGFQRHHKMNRFIKPILCAACYYGDSIVALQLHPLGNLGKESYKTLFGQKSWVSNIEHNINSKIADITSVGKWFIDGSVIYRFTDDESTNLTKDCKFQSLPVEAYRLTDLSSAKVDKTVRACISYTTENGKVTISPPIWKNMGSIGNRKVDHLDDEDDGLAIGMFEHQFDKVDSLLAVNLNFALNAATVITDHFGYEAIEPLRLDNLMIALKTVNLPKIDRSIKNTYDIGLKFTHAIAWVIGLSDKDMPLESYAATRSILRYLTSRGIVHRSALNKDNVFQKDMDMDSVPLLDRSVLEEKRKEHMSITEIEMMKG